MKKNKNTSLGIFIKCGNEIEIARRIKRKNHSNEQTSKEVYEKFSERNSQYKVNVEPHKKEYNLLLESLKDYSLNVLRDDFGIF